MKAPLTRIAGYAWLAVLGLAMLVSAADAWVRTSRVEERAGGCDAFGYLTMAKEVRRGVAKSDLPRFNVESEHTRLLIDHLRAQDAPPESWEELVAPHAHHYFPRSGHVGVQYPPGTGIALAIFPQGQALRNLNRAVIVSFLAIGALLLVVAGCRRAWLAAGGVVFALQFGLDILGGIGNASFSINAVLAPLLLAFAALYLALLWRPDDRRPRLACGLALVAGSFFGFAVLIRLAVIFLLPGVLILILQACRGRRRAMSIAFGAGVLMFGIVPLLVHQHRLAGAWHLSTYGRGDSSPPSIAVLASNLHFYFGGGPGGKDNWALVIALLGFAGMAWLYRGKLICAGLTLRQLAWSTLVLWGVPAAYFLTHRVTVDYYPIPATLGAIVVLSLGALIVACRTQAETEGTTSTNRAWRWLAVTAALIPGLAAIEQASRFAARAELPAEAQPSRFDVPAELKANDAWIYGDYLTGPLWYESAVPSYKVPFSDTKTRALVYRFVAARREPQYLISDCPTMERMLDEIRQMGGIPELRGELAGSLYYLVRWQRHE